MKASYSKKFEFATEQIVDPKKNTKVERTSTKAAFTLTATTVRSGSITQQASVPIKGDPQDYCLRLDPHQLALSEKKLPGVSAADESFPQKGNGQTVPRQNNGGMFNVKVGPAFPAGFAIRQSAHSATIQVIDSRGNILALWREVNGGSAKPRTPMSTTLLRQSTHVEQKALARMVLKDETLLITSQLPPCKNCQGAMRAATLNNQAKIVHQWMEKKDGYVTMQISVWQGGKKTQKGIG